MQNVYQTNNGLSQNFSFATLYSTKKRTKKQQQ